MVLACAAFGCGGSFRDDEPGEPYRATALQRAPEAVSFLVVGDWGWRGGYHQDEVARQMAVVADELDAAFVVTTGDNFYPSGVDSIDDPHWRSSFEDVYVDPSLQVPWYPTLGNHDWRGDVAAQVAYTAHSDRWRMPARYYTRSLPVGDDAELRLLFLDTTPLRSLSPPEAPDDEPWAVSAQLRWANRVLAETSATWTIVVGHHPIYSGGGRHGPSAMLARLLEPLLEKHGVDAYLAGHDHHLEHLQGESVHHFVSGGGSRVRGFRDTPRTVFGTSRPGFLAVSVTPRHLLVQLVDHLGDVLHGVTLEPRAQRGPVREARAR